MAHKIHRRKDDVSYYSYKKIKKNMNRNKQAHKPSS